MIPPPAGETGDDQPGPSRSRSSWALAVLILAACYLTGLAVNNLAASGAAGFVDRFFPRIGQHSAVDDSAIAEAWQTVQQYYVLRSVGSDIGTQGAQKGLIDALKAQYSDRFSNYLTADQYAQQQRNLSGQRTGSIGIALEARCAGETICAQNATPTELVIEEVLHNQPAERAGLRNGDVLVSVNGTALSSLDPDINKRLDDAASRVRGNPGTSVKLGVTRKGQAMGFTITRADLQIPAVYSERFGSVLDIEVTGFDENSGDDLRKQLGDGIAAGATSVVLDLRGNPGGLVTEAQSIASEFISAGKGRDVVVRRGRMTPDSHNPLGNPGTAEKVEHDAVKSGGLALALPLVVLVDGDSASASEIVTAALHDYHRATVVGERTFGKGSVQEDFPLSDGSDLHLTVERWFGPDGESIDGTGIAPDRTVALPNPDNQFRIDAQSADPSADLQLQAALAELQPKPAAT